MQPVYVECIDCFAKGDAGDDSISRERAEQAEKQVRRLRSVSAGPTEAVSRGAMV